MSKIQSEIYSLIFATGNPHKVEEVKFVLKDYPVEIEHVNIKGEEIQAENVGEIAKASALRAFEKILKPVFVEDTGLFIEALNGFPGPFAAYIHRTIGVAGVLKLLKGVANRRAEFRSAVAFSTKEVKSVCFIGTVLGRISRGERGSHGFGFDSIFEPDGGGGKTFGEMTIDEKNSYSHRACALRKFVEWYLKHHSADP
jgi:XTP/dITP diphosphohydrolase